MQESVWVCEYAASNCHPLLSCFTVATGGAVVAAGRKRMGLHSAWVCMGRQFPMRDDK
ncbi:predicted protein [Plenodomus lingam JN3]|uniref:Predicted protein n=1 Tax=Leptosphaeria maculans (strain JN3 / isolate v23.1.3 / race Av1-4-5-6-7-8) TaxID=985895 RepID=E5AFC0_LEPMJ|nr:predicted protein [Plenodomus lingam JN3]CBY01909.1 predicted protein [Plenodomus lingam JN3]